MGFLHLFIVNKSGGLILRHPLRRPRLRHERERQEQLDRLHRAVRGGDGVPVRDAVFLRRRDEQPLRGRQHRQRKRHERLAAPPVVVARFALVAWLPSASALGDTQERLRFLSAAGTRGGEKTRRET